jgi:hypothetical protein
VISITPRPCKIGSSINTRTEKHGDEDVPACDVPVAGITLDKGELNALLGEQYAHQLLFSIREGHTSPVFGMLEPFRLKGKIEDVQVSIKLGLLDGADEIELTSAKLKGLTLEPQAGGLTLLGCKVQVSGDHVPSIAGTLLNFLNRVVTIELHGGDATTSKAEKQQDLPINTFGDGEQQDAA